MGNSYNLTEVNHLYNIKDRVFVFEKGKIIHCAISKIYVIIDEDGIHILYGVIGDTPTANELLDVSYTEEKLSSSIEDIINHIEVL